MKTDNNFLKMATMPALIALIFAINNFNKKIKIGVILIIAGFVLNAITLLLLTLTLI